eukprot:GFUD01003312.1.p1 GENE.GFUD01003312.1~~GFUD01003312.1.p1  ORF type:complete len:1263 (-),score=415.62 GFUD01003312.1:210-3998(-)
MVSPDLRESLSDLIARRKLAGGEFSYVYLPSDEEVLGKKAVYKVLQKDVEVFKNFKDSNKLSGDTDLAFNSQVLKLITSLPFEDEREVSAVATPLKSTPTIAKVANQTTPRTPVVAPSPEKDKTPIEKTKLNSPGPKKDLGNKMSLGNLVARRRLEGGEFSYVYLPLEKVVSGKKALYNFLKNQTEEFNKLKIACKISGESDQEFDSRMLKEVLTVPYEKEVIETPMDTTSSESISSKRKLDNSTNGDSKKPKTDIGSTRNVFVEVEIFKSHDVSAHLTQIGAIEDRPTNPRKFFRPISSKKLLKLNDNVLEKLNMTKAGKNLTFKRFKTDIACTMDRQALVEFLNFLQAAKNNFKNLALYTYRKENFECLLNSLKFHGLGKRFLEIVNKMSTFEEMFKEKALWPYMPLKSLSDIYLKVMGLSVPMKNPSCEDLAEFLMKTSAKMTIKHSFSLDDVSKEVDFYTNLFKMFSANKMPENTYSVLNSISFVKNEKFWNNEPVTSRSASTSKVESKPPPKPQQQGEKSKIHTKVVKSSKKIEAMEVEEDNFIFETVSHEVLYPVLCQPVLVKLGTMDENTKFIKFNISKQLTKQSKANDWELLKDSAKVFWKNDTPYAFCHFCPILGNDNRYKSEKVKMIDNISIGSGLGEYKSLNKTDEEQRNLSTKVTVDLVITSNGNDPSKFDINKIPVTVLVKLMLKPGSLTSGNLKDFVLRPTDVLICQKSNIDGVKILNKFISVDRKQAVSNRAKVVIEGEAAKILSNGQILGTATLFQNDIKLLFQQLNEQTEMNSKFGSSPSCAILQVKHKQKRPIKTMGASRLYAQGSNPVLVRLDQYESTRITSKFAKAFIQFSPEFNEIIDQNRKVLKILKLKENEAIVKVLWKKNIPYAFVDIKIPSISNKMKPTIDFCDIVQNYELGSFAPLDFGDPLECSKVNMSICVDFTEKNCIVEGLPRLIKVYLKFKDSEIDKKKVLEEYFSIQKTYHTKIDILSVVFKPDHSERLAPQKTATNDMKATLVIRSKDDSPVILNAREVLADCQSMNPEENLPKFSVCGKRVSATMPVVMNQEMEQIEMMGHQRHGHRDMMAPMERMGNQWENNFHSNGGRGGLGGMMDGGRRPAGIRNPMMDGMDRNYMEHTDDLQDMAVAMDNKYRGGLGNPMFERRGGGVKAGVGGGMRGGGTSRGGFKPAPGRGRASFPPPAMRGRAKEANPLFDNLYEPQFKAKTGDLRNSLFEKARDKLNSKGPGPGVAKGQKTGPPKKTWSN